MTRLMYAAAIAALLIAPSAYAGNLNTFEEPDDQIDESEPMGGSNAAWIIPLVALLAIAAASGGNGGGDGNGGGSEESPETDAKCPGDPACDLLE